MWATNKEAEQDQRRLLYIEMFYSLWTTSSTIVPVGFPLRAEQKIDTGGQK